MRLASLFALGLLLAGCDSSPLGGGDTPFVYATSGTDRALDLVQTPSGDLVVVGSTEGQPRPADGTLARPSVLRFTLDGELEAAAVYRDVDFGDVSAAAWGREGLMVSLSAGPDGDGERTVGVFQADEAGERSASLLELSTGYLPQRALVAAPDGGVTAAVFAVDTSNPQVYRLTASGDIAWSTRLDGVQDVFALAAAPGGDVYAHGPSATSGASILARLDGETGQERWRVERPEGRRLSALASTSGGLVVLEDVSEQTSTRVVVARLGADGRGLGETVAASLPRAEAPETSPYVRGQALAPLPGGALAVGLVTFDGEAGPPSADLVVLTADGSEHSSRRFGVEGRWVEMNAIEVLADGRIAVAGSIGPARIGGFGGDDFDIRVSLYDVAPMAQRGRG